MVGISDEGRAALARADAVVDDVERQGLAGLGEEQLQILRRLLQQAATQPLAGAAPASEPLAGAG